MVCETRAAQIHSDADHDAWDRRLAEEHLVQGGKFFGGSFFFAEVVSPGRGVWQAGEKGDEEDCGLEGVSG